MQSFGNYKSFCISTKTNAIDLFCKYVYTNNKINIKYVATFSEEYLRNYFNLVVRQSGSK